MGISIDVAKELLDWLTRRFPIRSVDPSLRVAQFCISEVGDSVGYLKDGNEGNSLIIHLELPGNVQHEIFERISGEIKILAEHTLGYSIVQRGPKLLLVNEDGATQYEVTQRNVLTVFDALREEAKRKQAVWRQPV